MTRHGLSFDVEDWHQLSAMRIDGRPGDASPAVDECVARILDLCDELQVTATFFVLGLLAQQRPHLVRAIAGRGHEIASHSFGHRLVHTMTRGELRDDLRRSKLLLEDLAGREVVGFRAPEFSVRSLDSPCFTTLRELGFTYDSSVFPTNGLRYGIPGAPAGRFSIPTPAGALVELPLATMQLGSWRLPVAGGSHFRVLPTRFISWAARRADARCETLILYFHPYEFSRRILVLSGGVRRNRAIVKHLVLHNLATARIERSLRAVLSRLRFAPLRELAAESPERMT